MTKINTDFITLSQLLKMEDLVSSGGEVKYFLANEKVLVNDQEENRRGKKLYPNDVIKIHGKKFIIEK
ncbi:S4 domain-containing protein YaaA [Anaerorhabdus furcosa]|uniref:S4 domain protein YaaA n=1 Tax=Anaerorhabdus furcosa TaxID=118967 RepID=A0A1T4KSK2_9FIRM|nr:S4 domain-containing protein YaaA [Anaerorhabdus furcosa]SJZ45419.1 S4 domain protein YaaA [Anaerorhabdus furcosa]